MSDQEFHRILQKHAREASPSEFRDLLEKHGHLDACVDSLGKGVTDHGRREDSGDWTSPATSGYSSYKIKRDLLEKHILGRGPRGQFNAGGADTRVAALERQVAELARRVERLETRRPDSRYRL